MLESQPEAEHHLRRDQPDHQMRGQHHVELRWLRMDEKASWLSQTLAGGKVSARHRSLRSMLTYLDSLHVCLRLAMMGGGLVIWMSNEMWLKHSHMICATANSHGGNLCGTESCDLSDTSVSTRVETDVAQSHVT
jgi:hypothetical protein